MNYGRGGFKSATEFNNFSDRGCFRHYALLVHFCYLNFYTWHAVNNMMKRMKTVTERGA